jgi:hypothetical protein
VKEFENEELREILRSVCERERGEREEVEGRWRKLYIEELHNL